MNKRPSTNWDLLSADGTLAPAWGTAYMVQQLTIAVMNLTEEMRLIRSDMPLNDEAKVLRQVQAAADKAQYEENERGRKAWLHSQGIGSDKLRRLMCEAARRGEDVCDEAVARAMVESYGCTEKQQASIVAWWTRKYPNTVPPVTQLRQKQDHTKPDAKAEGRTT